MIPEFKPFPKVPRLRRDCIITEKIDGTNGVVYIGDAGEVVAGSRTKWLIGCDNYGFAAWVASHADELKQLGPGFHYGEWWGQGIHRRYGLDHKRFSLFNVDRYTTERGTLPECCRVVPTLYRGVFTTDAVDRALAHLRETGSIAALGFDKPEGVVVFHAASGGTFKVLLENDQLPKGVTTQQEREVAAARSPECGLCGGGHRNGACL